MSHNIFTSFLLNSIRFKFESVSESASESRKISYRQSNNQMNTSEFFFFVFNEGDPAQIEHFGPVCEFDLLASILRIVNNREYSNRFFQFTNELCAVFSRRLRGSQVRKTSNVKFIKHCRLEL